MTMLGYFESLKLTFFSFFLFYSFFESGSLFNDLSAKKETKKHATLRLANGVKINFALFLLLRISIATPLIFYLNQAGYNAPFFILGLALCLFIFLIHSLLKENFRLLTFIMLKVLSTLIPLLFLFGKIEIFSPFLVFFINLAPRKIYDYISKKYSKKSFFRIQKYKFVYLFFMIIIGMLAYAFTHSIIYFIFPICMCIVTWVSTYIWKFIEKY